jgi:hypothetical protein
MNPAVMVETIDMGNSFWWLNEQKKAPMTVKSRVLRDAKTEIPTKHFWGPIEACPLCLRRFQLLAHEMSSNRLIALDKKSP